MIDNGEEARKREQNRALDISKPTGAMIKHNYLNRVQDVIGVNRSDLEDILNSGSIEPFLFNFGIAALSGSLPLGISKLLSQKEFNFTALIAICACFTIFGIITLYCGFQMKKKRKSKIDILFEEAKTIK